jgi:hypothetical protein
MKEKNIIDEKIKSSINLIREQEGRNIDEGRMEANREAIMKSIRTVSKPQQKSAKVYMFRYLSAAAVLAIVIVLSLLVYLNRPADEIELSGVNETEELAVSIEDFVFEGSSFFNSSSEDYDFLEGIYQMIEDAITYKEDDDVLLSSLDYEDEKLTFSEWLFSENDSDREDEDYLGFILNDYESSFYFSMETN